MKNLYLCLIVIPVFLSACGGGGSSSKTPTPPPASTEPVWTQGVFQAESNFKDFCAVPRVGTNPATGNAYPDKAGSTTQENFWLRSWSNRTYLWYSEITDLNPANYTDRLDYFDTLKTNRTTASGNPVDKFHFTIPTDEYQQSVSSGAAVGYGARFSLIRSSPPREALVAYIEAGSPAETAGLVRGDRILEVDGEELKNGSNVNVLNAGLFPESEGENHTFLIENFDGSQSRTVTMTSQTVSAEPVRISTVLDRPDGSKVGYVLFNTFGTAIAEEALYDAFTTLNSQDIDDLVLDLRYNGGGFLDISSQLAYMIAGEAATNGRNFETLVFNDKYPTTNPVTGRTLTPTPFHKTGVGFSLSESTALPTLTLPRVFILSTGRTCSASESLINALEGINVEVILIGTTTCGKPYGFYATDNCGETYFTIQFRGENDKGFGDYSDGFSPFESGVTVGEPITGCVVDDDYSRALGDTGENLLEAALYVMDNGSCPVTLSQKTEPVWGQVKPDLDGLSLLNDPRIMRRDLLETSRIMLPGQDK